MVQAVLHMVDVRVAAHGVFAKDMGLSGDLPRWPRASWGWSNPRHPAAARSRPLRIRPARIVRNRTVAGQNVGQCAHRRHPAHCSGLGADDPGFGASEVAGQERQIGDGEHVLVPVVCWVTPMV